ALPAPDLDHGAGVPFVPGAARLQSRETDDGGLGARGRHRRHHRIPLLQLSRARLPQRSHPRVRALARSGWNAAPPRGRAPRAGRSPGGPAKVAVIATGFMGMLNGSAVANAASTGAFTIPVMKRAGYRPEFAAAIEGAGGTGGQIMPPVMGAAAFLIAEFLGISYGKIIVAAAIPAILYYVSLWMMVHYEAKKTGLRGLTKEE